MRSATIMSVAVFAGVLLIGTAAVQVKAGPDLVKFPADYEKAVKYGIVSNPTNKLYREFYDGTSQYHCYAHI